MLEAIPQQLRDRAQWVVWRSIERPGAKATKVPYQARNPAFGASVTDPTHWATFNEAVATLNASLGGNVPGGVCQGVGYVFSADDPYSGIDLDHTDDAQVRERQIAVANHFQSYAEISPSGYGLHIIVEGNVPYALKHKSVEIYSQDRYFTMTGNVWRDAPIADYSEALTTLWNEVRDWSKRAPLAHVVLGLPFEDASDQVIYDRASQSVNGQRFVNLWNGAWQNETDERTGVAYPSGSEADFALINILQFHSRHRLQIERMFRMSPQGQAMEQRKGGSSRSRHIEYLIHRMIDQSFDREPAQVDLEQLQNVVNEFGASIEASRANLAPTSPPIAYLDPGIAGASYEPVFNQQSFDVPMIETAGVEQVSPYVGPPGGGMLDEIMRFLYLSAPIPIPEVAVAAALGLFAGIVGATHTVHGLGLNCYVMMIASTGQGKDHARSGSARLLDLVAKQANMSVAPEFIGPSHLASGPGLIRVLDKNKSFCLMLDEFGIRLSQMSDLRAPPSVTQQRQMFLDLYSGVTAGFAGSAYSDKDKSSGRIASVAVSMVGTGTPSTIWDNLSAQQVFDGLLPRFTIIEYRGHKPARNEDAHLYEPPQAMLQYLSTYIVASMQCQSTGHKTHVNFIPDANLARREFETFSTAQENASDELGKAMWSRATAKTMKLSALAAVGVNPHDPRITLDQWNWAKAITVRETMQVLDKFAKGEVGRNVAHTGRMVPDHDAQSAALAQCLVEYYDTNKRIGSGYRIGPGSQKGDYAGSFRSHGFISHAYIMTRLSQNKAFKGQVKSAAQCIDSTIREFVQLEYMKEEPMRGANMVRLFGELRANAARAYYLCDHESVLALSRT